MKHSMVGWKLDRKLEPKSLAEALQDGLDQCMIGYSIEEIEAVVNHLNAFLEKKEFNERAIVTGQFEELLAKRKKLLNR